MFWKVCWIEPLCSISRHSLNRCTCRFIWSPTGCLYSLTAKCENATTDGIDWDTLWGEKTLSIFGVARDGVVPLFVARHCHRRQRQTEIWIWPLLMVSLEGWSDTTTKSMWSMASGSECRAGWGCFMKNNYIHMKFSIGVLCKQTDWLQGNGTWTRTKLWNRKSQNPRDFPTFPFKRNPSTTFLAKKRVQYLFQFHEFPLLNA